LLSRPVGCGSIGRVEVVGHLGIELLGGLLLRPTRTSSLTSIALRLLRSVGRCRTVGLRLVLLLCRALRLTEVDISIQW
jgi:hypothetical protein